MALAGAANIAAAVDIKVDFGSGPVMSGWTGWQPAGWGAPESKTVDGVEFTIVGPADNWRPRYNNPGGCDDLTSDSVSFEDDATGKLTLTIKNLPAGSHKLLSYFNAVYTGREMPITQTVNGGSPVIGTQTYNKDMANCLKLTAFFDVAGPGDITTIDYSMTANMPFFCGFELMPKAARLQFAAAESGDFEFVSPAVLEVILTGSEAGQTYTVDYAVIGGTAVKGTDYTVTEPATLTFNPGQTSKAISIDITNDGLDEDDETIIVELSNPTGPEAILGQIPKHTYTILDPRPQVGFETDSNSNAEDVTVVNVTVSLSFPFTQMVTVDYAVICGTATGGGVDYTLEPGTLTFNPGQTSKTISIAVVNDGVNEQNETILVRLSNPANARLGAITTFTYTIIDVCGLHLKVDLGLPIWCGYPLPPPCTLCDIPIAGTIKEGWTPWVSPRWQDMYDHGTVQLENIDGTGICMMLSTVRGGHMALKVCGMIMPSLNGGEPYGSPLYDPICNSWLYNCDFAENPQGDIVLGIYNLPAGEYALYSYHNHFYCERLSGDPTPVRCECQCNPQPAMPSITAMSISELVYRYLAVYGWWDVEREFLNGMPEYWDYHGQPVFPPDHPLGPRACGNVTTLQGAYNVQPQQVTRDEDLVPSLVKFRTDGSAVHIVYESGCCANDGVRPDRYGGRAILNAFELMLIRELNPGDFDKDGDEDMTDLGSLVPYWLTEGEVGNDILTGDLSLDCVVSFHDFAVFALRWLESCPPL